MKKLVVAVVILFSVFGFGQQKGNFFGSFESNSQWYLNDKGLINEFDLPVLQPENPLRSNTYAQFNYQQKNWTTGFQVESYQQKALLNYNPGYEKTNIGSYFLAYKSKKLDFTVGYFFEQFGSGLIFRTWEDRSLGINNALQGAKLVCRPTNYFSLKTIFGFQRSGFEVVKNPVFGGDAEFNLSKLLNFKVSEMAFAISYIGRNEVTNIENQNFSNLTSAYAARFNFSDKNFYGSTEFDFKSNDAIVRDHQIKNDFIKSGTALLLNLGFSKKGFGLDTSFRRLENMGFFSERSAKGNPFNDKILNFIPSLTKQHHSNLANIYSYQAQANVILNDESLVKTGEIGGQIDVFYNFKKGSFFGGKYGTKLAANFSNWNALGGTFVISFPQDYKTDFFGFGKKYYSDANVEISKKWNSNCHSNLSYINQYYNKKLIEETYNLVKTSILTTETTYKLSGSKSIKWQIEHLWANTDKKNWIATLIEYSPNTNFGVYLSDMYNYGNEYQSRRNHYYNFGASFSKNASRIALNFGRQRGGLVCVGGVCRFVPESSGLSLTFNTSF